MTTDARRRICMFFYGKAGRFYPKQKAFILPEEFRA